MKTPASFEYNVDVTAEVVKMAHAGGVSVEGELGCLGSLETGMMGEEDGHGAEGKLDLDMLLYIIRCFHLPDLISKTSSIRNTFVQTRLPVFLQNVEDGKSLCFLRQNWVLIFLTHKYNITCQSLWI
jgi:hypothetical protein